MKALVVAILVVFFASVISAKTKHTIADDNSVGQVIWVSEYSYGPNIYHGDDYTCVTSDDPHTLPSWNDDHLRMYVVTDDGIAHMDPQIDDYMEALNKHNGLDVLKELSRQSLSQRHTDETLVLMKKEAQLHKKNPTLQEQAENEQFKKELLEK